MRLGVVLTGAGAYAACGVGVLEELERRNLLPYAVCGLQSGAWPAALFCAGHDRVRMWDALLQAQRMGGRLLAPAPMLRAALRSRAPALLSGRRLEHLLRVQAGERILALCPRRGAFLCRTAKGGRRVIFATQAEAQEPGAVLVLQASLAFAARAAMAVPPFLAPVTWMGSPLVPDADVAAACGVLLAMGAQRVLIVEPHTSPQRDMDALELTAAAAGMSLLHEPIQNAAVLRAVMPAQAGALSMEKLALCAEAGRRAASAELDALLAQLGMAQCRVLPFKRLRG